MYTYIKGTLTELHPTHAIIENQGLGYHILIPLTTYSALSGNLNTALFSLRRARRCSYSIWIYGNQ